MTVMGSHTAHELSDLLANLDGFVASMRAHADGAPWLDWSSSDPAAADDWRRDWQSFSARWGPAAAAARAAVASGREALAGWDLALREGDYAALLSSYKPSDGDPTSFDDLDRRWRAAAAKGAPAAPVYVALASTAPDADIGAYKAADAGVKAVEATAAAAGRSLLPSPTVLIVSGLCAAVFLGIVLKVGK